MAVGTGGRIAVFIRSRNARQRARVTADFASQIRSLLARRMATLRGREGIIGAIEPAVMRKQPRSRSRNRGQTLARVGGRATLLVPCNRDIIYSQAPKGGVSWPVRGQ